MKASVLLFKDDLVIAACGRAVGLAESVVGREGSFAFREFSIWVIALECVENVSVLVESVGGIFMTMNLHLEKPLGGTKKFDMETVWCGGIFKFFFDGIVAANIEHVIDEK